MTAPRGSNPSARFGPDWPASLDRVLERQQALLCELDTLSQRQAELIDADDVDRLLGLLGQRQGVVDELAGLNERLGAFRSAWESLMAALPAARRAAYEKRVAVLARTAADIESRDEAARVELKRRRDALADRLAGASRNRAAVAAYGTPVVRTRPAQFEDRRG